MNLTGQWCLLPQCGTTSSRTASLHFHCQHHRLAANRFGSGMEGGAFGGLTVSSDRRPKTLSRPAAFQLLPTPGAAVCDRRRFVTVSTRPGARRAPLPAGAICRIPSKNAFFTGGLAANALNDARLPLWLTANDQNDTRLTGWLTANALASRRLPLWLAANAQNCRRFTAWLTANALNDAHLPPWLTANAQNYRRLPVWLAANGLTKRRLPLWLAANAQTDGHCARTTPSFLRNLNQPPITIQPN